LSIDRSRRSAAKLDAGAADRGRDRRPRRAIDEVFDAVGPEKAALVDEFGREKHRRRHLELHERRIRHRVNRSIAVVDRQDGGALRQRRARAERAHQFAERDDAIVLEQEGELRFERAPVQVFVLVVLDAVVRVRGGEAVVHRDDDARSVDTPADPVEARSRQPRDEDPLEGGEPAWRRHRESFLTTHVVIDR
jgi:hypothetical protein